MSNYQVFGADILPKSLTTTPWQTKLAQAVSEASGEKVSRGTIDRLLSWQATMNKKMLPGGNPVVYLSANAKVSSTIAETFLDLVESYRGRDVKEGGLAMAEELAVGAAKTARDVAKGLAKGVAETAGGLGKTSKALPWVLGILAVGVAGYLIFAGRKGVNVIPSSLLK
jgi:hypothetical protein